MISFGQPYWGYSNPVTPFSSNEDKYIVAPLMALTEGGWEQDISNGKQFQKVTLRFILLDSVDIHENWQHY